MPQPLYIPKTITVGFQARSDTFTGKLAYIIYTDHTGKLRKEGSWNSWRSKSIEPITVDNEPMPNFTLNKGVQRSSEWFGSGRSMVRVWDPRDFEFEITVDNLLNVLMHADVSKRDITEKCVYAWQGTNLVLLPVNSIEYQESLKHTEKQGLKVSSKELVVGHTYSIKKDAHTRVVYLGRQDRYEQASIEDPSGTKAGYYHYGLDLGYKQTKKAKKYHVFIDQDSKEVYARDPSGFIAACVSDDQHSELAALYDVYYASVESQPVSGATISSTADGTWVQLSDGAFVRLECTKDYHNDQIKVSASRFARYDEQTNSFLVSHNGYKQYYYPSTHTVKAQNPTNHTADGDEVVMLCNHVRAVYQMLGDEDKKSYNPTNAIRTKMTKYQMGAICWRLADGKTSKDRITY